MYAKSVEELLVWQRADALGDAISAIVRRPSFNKDFKLRTQLADASDSIAANIAEGFGQQTDKGFAHYLYYSRASALETATRLRVAHARGHISRDERDRLRAEAEAIVKMVTGLIRYLERSDWPNRV